MRKPQELSLSSLFSKYDLLLYSAVSLLAFGRCIFWGQAYFDNDLLAQFGPWRAFLKDQLAQGHFPLWDPYLLGGQPFFADLQNMMLYPFNWLTLPFSIPYGLSIFFLIHMFWAALGMHLWLRLLGLTQNSSRMGALLFALSNFFWLELIHPPVIAAFAWLPWFFAGLEALFQTLGPKNAFYAGFSFAMLFLCGSIQVTLGAFYGGLAYSIFRIWIWISKKKKKLEAPKKLVKSYLLIGFLLLWGALPLVGQLVPSLEYAALTSRGAPNQTYEQSNTRLPLNPSTLYQFLFPRFTLPTDKSMAEAIQFGNTDKDTSLAANLGYLGVWLPFLALSTFQWREKKIIWFLGIFTLVSLAICFGRYTPVHRYTCAVLPGFSIIRVPYRYLYLYVLAASALAAFGLETLFLAEAKVRLKSSLIYSALLYFAALFKASQTWREIVSLVLGVLALFLWNTRNPWKKLGYILFPAALVVPLLLNGWSNFIPGPATNFDYAVNSKSIVEAVEPLKPFRVMFFNSEMGYPIQVSGKKLITNYPQNASCALKIKNFGGYNPLVLQTKLDTMSLSLDSLIHIGAIRGILKSSDHPIPGFKQKNLLNYRLFEYQGRLSYAFIPKHLQVITDPVKRLSVIQKPDFDPTQEAILSGPLAAGDSTVLQSSGPVLFQYQMVQDEPDGQSFSMKLSRDRIVIFPEVMFPGWKAQVDGQSTPLLTADHLLRAVFLKAGSHQVEFEFEPFWWGPIKIGLLLWALMTFLGFASFKLLRKRSPHA